MKDKAMKVARILIPVASLAATIASGWLKDKEFDEKVAAKVAENLAKANGEES
jgi:hypothetical protein